LAQERFACLLCVTLEQARAFELLQQPDSAIIAYERIVNLPSMDNEERHLTYPAALRRLGELYDNKGDRKKALEYDGRLVDLWKDADPELQGVIRDVRRRMAELAGEPPRR
jgi:tetratricopeptide (TPR) repeat protein